MTLDGFLNSLHAKYNGVESEIAIGSLNVLHEYNLEELREFYCYYKNKKNSQWSFFFFAFFFKKRNEFSL
jgi:hypothetical protein